MAWDFENPDPQQLAAVHAASEAGSSPEEQSSLAGKMEELGRFASGIIHDLSNVLGIILASGALARRTLPSDSSERRYVENILSAGERAQALVDQILAFCRGRERHKEPVHVETEVAATCSLLQASLPPRIALQSTLSAPDVYVCGEAIQIHQLVMNLCTNAVQAMNGAGTLRVALERVAIDAARGPLRGKPASGCYVRLRVRDTGSGIDRKIRTQIFDPLFTTKPQGSGTGLGLFLVQSIVKELGGHIDLASEPDRGTTFSVYLPVAAGAVGLDSVSGQAARPLSFRREMP